MIKYLSLFSGIGGFEVGIQNSRHNMECVGYAEIDKWADSIYSRHFPSHNNLGDVRRIRTSELPKFDLLVGGFPCQSFSNSGNKQGFQDTRGTLFFEIARILQDCRPRYFLLENVRGLLSNKYGETFKRILQILAKMGYDVEWFLLNSENFGVAHYRERVFLKGYFRAKCGREILSNSIHYGEPISGMREREHSLDEPHLKIRETTKKGYKEAYVHDGVLCNRANRKIAKGIVRKGYCGALQTGKIWGVVMPDLRIRYLTPLECERLQGFDDGWTEFGKDGEAISDSQRYKCLGNAVTTNVVTYIMNNWDLKGE